MITSEHTELIKKQDITELDKYEDDDIHVIDYEANNFHCTEVFSHDGIYRACAKTKEEAIKKAVHIYEEAHK